MDSCNDKDNEIIFFQKVLQTQYNFKYIYEMACDQNPRTATEQF